MCIPLSLLCKGSVKCVPPFVARQRLGKHVPATTNTCINRIAGRIFFCAIRVLFKDYRRVCGRVCKACIDRGLVCSAKGRIFNTMYMYEIYTWWKANHMHKKQTHLLVRDDVTLGLLPQEFSWGNNLWSWAASHQDELIGGNPLLVK
jgi:hypothetical protein